MTRKSSFITRARSLGVDTELCWGDEETPWEDEVSDNESVTVDKDGVRPLPDTVIVEDWENGASSLDAYYSDVASGADGSPGNRVIADAAKAGSYGLEMEAGGMVSGGSRLQRIESRRPPGIDFLIGTDSIRIAPCDNTSTLTMPGPLMHGQMARISESMKHKASS